MDDLAHTMQFYPRSSPDPFRHVAVLAARLGVPELEPDASAGEIVIVLRDGRRYALFDLVTACLDRMEAR